MKNIIQSRQIRQVIMAVPDASGQEIREIVDICSECNIDFKIAPASSEMVNGKSPINQLRDVKVEDLLGREEVNLDTKKLRSFIANKTVLVTGAAGSIGAEICRQLLPYNPFKIVLYDKAENNMHFLGIEFEKIARDTEIVQIIGDINDRAKFRAMIGEHKPQIVFHAAAHKHVLLMELNPEEAIKNNLAGTIAAAQLSEEGGVETFVNISTDKAVNPVGVMGVSKKLAEFFIQDFGRQSRAKFVTVRFGNVLDSDGSVIPIFRKQIAEGGPVTVSHPDIARYFMTIPEAAQLVLEAAAIGNRGDIFILNMGRPIKILDLAKDMIHLSGLEVDKDIQIVFTGLMLGEKMHEELWNGDEKVEPTVHDKILRITSSNRIDGLDKKIQNIIDYVDRVDREGLLKGLQEFCRNHQSGSS